MSEKKKWISEPTSIREDTSVGSGAAAAIEKWDFLRRSTSCSFVVAFFSGCSSSATKTITSSGAIKHKYTRKTREGSRRHPLCETASDASEPHRIGTRKKRRVIVDVLSCRSCQNTVSEVLRSVNRRGLVEQQWLFSYRADTHTHITHQHLCPQTSTSTRSRSLAGVNTSARRIRTSLHN